MSLQIVLVYNRANPFGIANDANLLEKTVRQIVQNLKLPVVVQKIRHADLLEPPVACDICIHLEIPSTVWMPWAITNILMINSEWYVPAWNSLLPRFDKVWVKTKGALRDISGSTFFPWCSEKEVATFEKEPQSTNFSSGCLWLLGGSQNKRKAAEAILPLWKDSWPKLHCYTTSPLSIPTDSLKNVELQIKDVDSETRTRLQAFFPLHLCLSASEGFGLAAVEAEAAGASLLVNDIDAYKTVFEGSDSVHWIQTKKVPNEKYVYGDFADFSDSVGLEKQLDEFFSGPFQTLKGEEIREEQKKKSAERGRKFREVLMVYVKQWASNKQRGIRHMPPVLDSSLCPPISVVTLTYNRRKFLDLAFHNLILSEYPKDKIEWVIVDDSDKVEEQGSDKIAQFANRAPVAQVVYVPLPKKLSIGAKRNLGVDRASNEIILFMDDDDHYPETSFRRRVAWLTNHPWKPQCVGCATIACYDLKKGISAVNTPPWELSPAQRVSEATLTFYKKFWEQQKFPLTSLAEGETFLAGREKDFLEIPPQQIIVAFSHGENSSGRRIPGGDAKPGCFWNFPKEYLIWVHKLAGVEVEEEKETSNAVVKAKSKSKK